MSLEVEFRKIAETVKRLKSTPTEDELLEMYALYKQAVVGDCNKPKPGTFDLKGKFKWEAWNKKKGMDQDLAKKKYIEYADVLIKKYGDGGWTGDKTGEKTLMVMTMRPGGSIDARLGRNVFLEEYSLSLPKYPSA